MTFHWEYNFPGFVKQIIMHEIKIAGDLSAIVLETAQNNKLSKVTRINVIFGELIQVVPAIFEFALSEAIKNTIAESAELNIEIIKVKLKCRNCGEESRLKENLFACNNCGSVDLDIINGKELFVKSIEGE